MFTTNYYVLTNNVTNVQAMDRVKLATMRHIAIIPISNYAVNFFKHFLNALVTASCPLYPRFTDIY